MTVKCLPLGELHANCYYVSDGETALLIDVGEYSDKLKNFLENTEVKPSAVLLTHGHFDHICGVKGLVDDYKIPVFISAEDKPSLNSIKKSLTFIAPSYNLEYLGENAEIITVEDNKNYTVGSLTFSVISLPGHTAGGVGYIIGNALFSGDTVFRGSVGRTDLPTSDFSALKNSIVKIKKQPDDTLIFAGHGEATTLKEEKQNNFYFQTEI